MRPSFPAFSSSIFHTLFSISSPSSSGGENPENVDAGGVLSVLNWSENAFQTLLLNCRMPAEYGARYATGSETAADAPYGYVTLFTDFFHEVNFRLPLTVFMADLLECYRIHISQLSPLGMLQVQLGFYSLFAHKGVKKILEVPPKGFHQWKSKFFYIKAVALVCKLEIRSVYQRIPKEMLAILYRRNVIGLWRMFASDNKVKIGAEPCDDGEEGWYKTIVGNFHILERAALEASVAARSGVLCSLSFLFLTLRPCRGVVLAGEELICFPVITHWDLILLLEGLDILGATLGIGGVGTSTRAEIVKKRKLVGALVGASSKNPTLHRQKTTSLDAHGHNRFPVSWAQPISFFIFVVVATTIRLPPPPSPSSMLASDARRVEEPEHTVQVENVTETTPLHEAEVPVTRPVGEIAVQYDIMDSFNNVIDPTINWGSTEGGGC
ncbi:hypothetical protein Hanom_Chr12g01163461 [Helianthus anomalus]